MTLNYNIIVTFISATHFLNLSHFIFEIFPYTHNLLFEIFGQVFDFFFKLLYNSLFVKFIVNLNLTNLCFYDCDSLFNLIIRYLSDHNLHFIFYFVYKLTFVLSIHRSTISTTQHAGNVCSSCTAATLEHCEHLLKLNFNIYVNGGIFWCFTYHAGRTIFFCYNFSIISNKQRVIICLC